MSTSNDSVTLIQLRKKYACMLDPNFNCAVDSVVPSGPVTEAVFEASIQLVARIHQKFSDLSHVSLTACQDLSIDISCRIEPSRLFLINICIQCGKIVYDMAWIYDIDLENTDEVVDQDAVVIQLMKEWYHRAH